eukprot:scaffold40972_cov261-Skeletonema_dohrnii-CCMP3373.AAC.1
MKAVVPPADFADAVWRNNVMAPMTTAAKFTAIESRGSRRKCYFDFDGEDPDRADADRTANYTSHDIVSNLSKLRDLNNYSILMGLDTIWSLFDVFILSIWHSYTVTSASPILIHYGCVTTLLNRKNFAPNGADGCFDFVPNGRRLRCLIRSPMSLQRRRYDQIMLEP